MMHSISHRAAGIYSSRSRAELGNSKHEGGRRTKTQDCILSREAAAKLHSGTPQKSHGPL
jgi:hypothetical protein